MNMKRPLPLLARLAPALALWSCAAPKAVVVEDAPVAKKQEVKEAAAAPETPSNNTPDDGIRLPDMLTLPGDNELRSTGPASTGGGSGAVIARPPASPPPDP
jgi:hypothetical protein